MLGFAFRVVSQVHAGCPRSDIDLLEPCHPAASLSREFFGLHHHFVPDPREDPKSRSQKGVPIKYPLVV